jgi:hypothetical protein
VAALYDGNLCCGDWHNGGQQNNRHSQRNSCQLKGSELAREGSAVVDVINNAELHIARFRSGKVRHPGRLVLVRVTVHRDHPFRHRDHRFRDGDQGAVSGS